MEMKQRAMQCYMVLLSAAHNRQTMTYEDVHELTGMATPGMGDPLDYIFHYCRQKGLPPLSVLVVQKHVGLPGKGYPEKDPIKIAAEQELVFGYRWYEHEPPSSEDLQAAWQAGKS